MLIKKNIFVGNFNCTAKIRYHVPIPFQGVYDISHCSFCKCYPGNHIDCFQRSITGRTKKLCNNCELIKVGSGCPYCTDPQNELFKVSSGDHFHASGYNCISCQCSNTGIVYCHYNNTRQCTGQQKCQHYFKLLKNETIPYQCKTCVFNGLVRLPDSTGKVMINGKQDLAICNCKVNGEVNCKVEKKVKEFSFEIHCLNCSSTEIIEEKFKRRGKFVTHPTYFTRLSINFVKKLFSILDCSIDNINIPHKNTSFISKESTKHCLQCACFMGTLKCSEPVYSFNNYFHYCTDANCKKLLESPYTKTSKINSYNMTIQFRKFERSNIK